MLHVGPALPETVEFFSTFRCRVHFVDLFSELPIPSSENNADQDLNQWFTDVLAIQAGTLFDVCLFWDLFNFLERDAIAAFAAQYPEVDLDVNLDDRLVDVAAEGFDLVVRIGSLKDTSFIARRMADCPLVLCASPDYLRTHGVPQTPADLVQHNVLAFTGNRGPHEWRYADQAGETGQVSLQGTFKANSGDILCRAALQNVGIVLLPIFYVAEHLESRRLQHVLPRFVTSPQREIYAVFAPNRFQSTRLRLFIDHLVATSKALPWES